MSEKADISLWPRRFADKVDIRGPDDCWLWRAVLVPNGYGQIWHDGKMRSAHRMALEFAGISVRPDQVVLHRCDTPRCCNPSHLHLGSQADNLRDMVAKGRSLRGARHSQARLTEKDVLAIRASTRQLKQIALDFGVAFGTVLDIRYRRSWKHLP